MADLVFFLSSASSPTPKHRRNLLRPSPPPPKPLLASPAPTRRLLKYYARLASKLARDGKLRDFLMIAESVLASPAVAADAPLFVARVSPRLVSEGVVSALRDGNLDGVVRFLTEAQRLGFCVAAMFDESAMEALQGECRRLVRAGRLVELVELMEVLAGCQFSIKDTVDLEHVLGKIVDKCGPDLAIRYANAFPHSQLLLCSLIERFGRKRDLASAIRAFEALKQKSGGINMFAYRAIIDACGVCGDYQLSRRLFEELLAEKIVPNVYVMNSLMNVNAHDLNYTFQIFKLMQSMGITADLPSYNILLKACCNAERVDLAQNIYRDIKHMASKGALKLDVFTYSTMMKVFADAKMWQMAFSINEDMISAGVIPNVVTWSSLISAYTSAGLIERALKVFDEMLMAGCEPNAQCCNILLNGCIQSYQYDRAFRLFYTWKENGFKIHAAANLKRNKDEGPVVFPFKPSISTFNILMKACGTDFTRAKGLMDEMRKMGLTPNSVSWSILIDIYGSSKNAGGALQVFRAMRDVGIKPDVITYTTMIKTCIESKNLEVAYSVYEEMKRFRIQPNLVTYNTLLRARSRYGSLLEVQQCLSIYQDMRKAGYNPNDYYLKELIEEWCEGVLSSKNRSQRPIEGETYRDTSYSTLQPNVLLEKVALHLQKDVSHGHAIDIRGLTKLEARIVILSVLRMIKERHSLGQTIGDDIIINCEVANEQRNFGANSNHAMQVQQTITKLLQDDLGLDVKIGHGSPDYVNTFEARRPHGLGVMKVEGASLIAWLEKKSKH